MDHIENATERLHTGDRPKEHDLGKLIQQAARFDSHFAAVFPIETDEDQHLFDLLQRVYVDARYGKSYRITEAELSMIKGRVVRLRELEAEVCSARITTRLLHDLQNPLFFSSAISHSCCTFVRVRSYFIFHGEKNNAS